MSRSTVETAACAEALRWKGTGATENNDMVEEGFCEESQGDVLHGAFKLIHLGRWSKELDQQIKNLNCLLNCVDGGK